MSLLKQKPRVINENCTIVWDNPRQNARLYLITMPADDSTPTLPINTFGFKKLACFNKQGVVFTVTVEASADSQLFQPFEELVQQINFYDDLSPAFQVANLPVQSLSFVAPFVRFVNTLNGQGNQFYLYCL